MSALTDRDRGIIARARKLAAVRDVCEHTGKSDIISAAAAAFGEAQFLLEDLAGIAERLGDGGQA